MYFIFSFNFPINFFDDIYISYFCVILEKLKEKIFNQVSVKSSKKPCLCKKTVNNIYKETKNNGSSS